jgi:3-hydroxyisobutyrate dehydrogenase-like beta-hydroxyacid dehydrogenase
MGMTDGRERVGFLGLGLMGHGMARNIAEKGWPLTVAAHRKREAADDLVGRGAVEVGTPREVGERSDVVVLCVTGSPQVSALMGGPDGLAAGLKAGSVVVDCSTSDPVASVAIADDLKARGIDFVDAPLSRTPKEAFAGTLDTMVGAEPAVLQRVRPVLEAFAAKIIHVGGVGDGHRMKLLNNFLSLGYAAIYSEALALAAKVGIAPERFDAVIRGGRMDCGFYQTFMGYLIEGNREAHKFTLVNARKDLTYLESMAGAAGVANPVGNAVKNSFVMACAAGGEGPEDYVPHLPEFVGRRNGVTLAPVKTAGDG